MGRKVLLSVLLFSPKRQSALTSPHPCCWGYVSRVTEVVVGAWLALGKVESLSQDVEPDLSPGSATVVWGCNSYTWLSRPDELRKELIPPGLGCS